MNSFRKVLKQLRTSRKMSQQELANVLGKSQPTIVYYEKGEKEPGIDTINKIADYFNVTTDYLLGRSSEDIYVRSDDQVLKKEIGKRLRYLRKFHGDSLRGLAQKIDINYSTLHKIEIGTNYPSVEVLTRLVDVYNVKYGYFLGEIEN